MDGLGELCRSDHLRELVKPCGKGESGMCIESECVVASSQILDEGVASDGDAGGSVPFEAPHRTKPGLEAPVVSFDSVVGVPGGVVTGSVTFAAPGLSAGGAPTSAASETTKSSTTPTGTGCSGLPIATNIASATTPCPQTGGVPNAGNPSASLASKTSHGGTTYAVKRQGRQPSSDRRLEQWGKPRRPPREATSVRTWTRCGLSRDSARSAVPWAVVHTPACAVHGQATIASSSRVPNQITRPSPGDRGYP